MIRTSFKRWVARMPWRAEPILRAEPVRCTEPMTTVVLSTVSRGAPYGVLDVETSVRDLLARPVEAAACTAEWLVSCNTAHSFVKAAHDAFYDHHPLTIRPDDVWFCIAQGFAAHVKQNVESLRSRFVKHAGKKQLVIEREDFILGQQNPWPEAFAAFSAQMAEHVGQLHDLVSARFSTTTPATAAAFDVCLMDTFQGYFDYEMRMGCGIPEITVFGTAADWSSMIPRVRRLAEYGLAAWSAVLVPILEKIAATAAGNVDPGFWQSFFRYQGGSGPAELTGWIVALFPYLVTDGRTNALGPNEYLPMWQEHFDRATGRPNRSLDFAAVQGPGIFAIPQSLVSAPVRCVDLNTGKAHDLRFVAGMFGVEQHARTHALSAAFGWAIVYDDPS